MLAKSNKIVATEDLSLLIKSKRAALARKNRLQDFKISPQHVTNHVLQAMSPTMSSIIANQLEKKRIENAKKYIKSLSPNRQEIGYKLMTEIIQKKEKKALLPKITSKKNEVKGGKGGQSRML